MKGLHWIVRLLIVTPGLVWLVIRVVSSGNYEEFNVASATAVACLAIYWVIRPLLREVKS